VYEPSAALRTVLATDVFTFVIEISTSGIEAPVASWTIPEICET
jgi:hypothetical protein